MKKICSGTPSASATCACPESIRLDTSNTFQEKQNDDNKRSKKCGSREPEVYIRSSKSCNTFQAK